jgi:GMP synthase-like glutamine amidotransferase
MLGICLGAQLLAEVAGGHVYERDAEETGLLPVELVADDPLFAGVASPFVAFEHHSYSFSVPPHATLLARRPDGAQAFRLGRAWGLQFHPEVDLAAAVACTEERLAAGAEERPGDGAEAAAAASLRARLARLTPAYEQFCPRLLHNWLQLAA